MVSNRIYDIKQGSKHGFQGRIHIIMHFSNYGICTYMFQRNTTFSSEASAQQRDDIISQLVIVEEIHLCGIVNI